MLNLKFIQDNPELVIEKLQKKNFNASAIVGNIIELYQQKNIGDMTNSHFFTDGGKYTYLLYNLRISGTK